MLQVIGCCIANDSNIHRPSELMGSMPDQSTMPENVVKRVPLTQEIGEYLETVRTAPFAHARSAARLLLAWKASLKVQ